MRARLVCTIAGAALLAQPLQAQRFPSFGGVELRAGVVFPENAVPGTGLTLESDVGYFWRPELRVIAGLSRFQANIDREPGGDEGSFTAHGISAGVRYDGLVNSRTGGYARVALTAQSVSADAWDGDVDALLSGLNAGASLAVGVRRTLNERIAATLELRQTRLNNIGNTAIEIGARWQRRGPRTYAGDVALDRDPGPVRMEPRPVEQAPPVTPAPRPPLSSPALPHQPFPSPAAEPVPPPRAPAPVVESRPPAPAPRADRAEERAAAEAMLRQGIRRAVASMSSATDLREEGDAFVVTISGRAFASGSSSLAAAARSELRVLATVLAGYPGHLVMVEGHTDASGDASRNQVLSTERAAAVRAGLIVEGVDPLWTAAEGLGSAAPVQSNDTAAGRAANRRVEIRIRKQRCNDPRAATSGGLTCST